MSCPRSRHRTRSKSTPPWGFPCRRPLTSSPKANRNRGYRTAHRKMLCPGADATWGIAISYKHQPSKSGRTGRAASRGRLLRSATASTDTVYCLLVSSGLHMALALIPASARHDAVHTEAAAKDERSGRLGKLIAPGKAAVTRRPSYRISGFRLGTPQNLCKPGQVGGVVLSAGFLLRRHSSMPKVIRTTPVRTRMTAVIGRSKNARMLPSDCTSPLRRDSSRILARTKASSMGAIAISSLRIT